VPHWIDRPLRPAELSPAWAGQAGFDLPEPQQAGSAVPAGPCWVDAGHDVAVQGRAVLSWAAPGLAAQGPGSTRLVGTRAEVW